jgi:PAS domain S-box-containing protein
VYRDVLRTQQPQTFVNDTDLGGRHYVFEISAYPSGSGISVFVKDITARKDAEEAILREKLLSDSIVNNIPAGVAFLDNDFVLRKCNRGYGDMIRKYTPYTPEQAIGMSYYDYAAGSRPQVEAWFQRVRDRAQVETIFGFELTLQRDGQEEKTYWDTSVAPVLNPAGKAEGILILTQDVTERKRAEEELQRRAEELAALNLGARQLNESLDTAQVAESVVFLCAQTVGVRLAWLLRANPDGSLEHVAHFPVNVAYPAQVTIRWDDSPLGQGPIGRAIRSRQPVVFADLAVAPDYIPWREAALREGFVTSATLPLVSGNQVFGALNLYSDQAGFFSPDRVAFFQTFAGQAAGSIQNAQLFVETQRRVQELEALYETSLLFTQLREVPVVCQNILDALEHLLRYKRGAIALRDEASGELQLFAHACMGLEGQALQDEFARVRGFFRLPQGITRWVAEHGQSIRVGDVHSDPRYLEADPAIQSEMAVPLIAGGRAIGAINVESNEPNAFSAHDERLLATLANQAVIAIENARLYEEMNRRQAQLRELTAYLQTAREEERAYVAREIHDEFGQTLTALKMDLSWLARRLPQRQTDLAAKVNAMAGLVDGAVNTVRRIATELRPGLLDDLGLVAAIEWQAQEFARRTGLTVELHLGDQDLALDRDLATALFRIFQEALTNIARHAAATRVEIELVHQPDLLKLVVADNGKGIEPAQILAPRSLGLLGMRERARALGGDVVIEGSPGQGTTVTVHIPRQDL